MPGKFSPLRWGIVLLVTLGIGFVTIDRQAISIVAPLLQTDLGITAQEYGQVISVFMLVYALAALPLGWLFDWLGARYGLALALLICLAADLAAGSVNSILVLGLVRGVYALGAPGGTIAAAKVIAEWLPPRERGSAFGLLAAGRDIASALAPLLLVSVTAAFGWRSVFFLMGLLGLPFALLWVWAYRRPAEHPVLTEWEAASIAKTQLPDVSLPAGESELARWFSFWGRREAWLLILSRVLTDQFSALLLFWLPLYLTQQRSISLQNLGWMSLFIYLPAAVGGLFGGVLSDALIWMGGKPLQSRIRVMAGAAVLVLAILLLPVVSSLTAIMVVVGIASIGAAIWHATMDALVVDLTPARSVGSVMGGIITCSTLVRTVSMVLVGMAVDALTNGMELIFGLTSVLYLVALGLIMWAAKPQRLATESV